MQRPLYDSIDTTFIALQRVDVHFVTRQPWPKSVASWERTPNGYRVVCSCDLGTRIADLTDAAEIDFAAKSGAALFLRDGDWRQYSNGLCAPYEHTTFIVGDPTVRTPFGVDQ